MARAGEAPAPSAQQPLLHECHEAEPHSEPSPPAALSEQDSFEAHGITQESALTVLSLSLEYHVCWPPRARVATAKQHLQELLGERRPDVICVQDSLDGEEPLRQLGYSRICSSLDRGETQAMLADAVYDDADMLSRFDPSFHGRLVMNAVYVSNECRWEVAAAGTELLSTPGAHLTVRGLHGAIDQRRDVLPRSVNWLKLASKARPAGPFFLVLNAELSGGAFEDPFFLQLGAERRRQVEELCRLRSSLAAPEDSVILAGALSSVCAEACIGSVAYFQSVLRPSFQVLADAQRLVAAAERGQSLQERFVGYSSEPLALLADHGWNILTAQRAGSDQHGRMIDHIAAAGVSAAEPVLLDVPEQLCRRKALSSTCSAVFAVETIELSPDRGGYIYDEAEADIAGGHYEVNASALSRTHFGAGILATLEVATKSYQPEWTVACEAVDQQEPEHEDSHSRLTCEMQDLRGRCDEKLESISDLSQKLMLARKAVDDQAGVAMEEQATLEEELQGIQQEAARLEQFHSLEEDDLRVEVEHAQQQLTAMEAVREALQAQVLASQAFHEQFQEQLDHERRAREQVAAAGHRQLVEWKQRKEMIDHQLQSNRDSGTHDLVAWKTKALGALAKVSKQIEDYDAEEVSLKAQISERRCQQEDLRKALQLEASIWKQEAETIRTEMAQTEERAALECSEDQRLDAEIQKAQESMEQVRAETKRLDAELQQTAEDDYMTDFNTLKVELQQSESDQMKKSRKRECDDNVGKLQAEIRKLNEKLLKAKEESDSLDRQVSKANSGLFGHSVKPPPVIQDETKAALDLELGKMDGGKERPGRQKGPR